LTFETNRDDAVTAYVHDPLGDVTNRVVPGGLQWDAIYNHAGQVQQDRLVGTGNVGTRTNTYTYFASGTPFAGLLNTMTDGRGLVSTYGYDDRLRQTSISRTDSNYGQVNTAWSYDARGYATNITEQYTTNDLGNYNPKVITRAFDPYGQLSSETVSVGGSGFSSASQNWDAAGRRTGLSINDAVYGFSSRADGALIYASDPTGSGSYAYDTAGVLTNRAVGSRTTSITARDGEGRPSTIATAINGASLMTETLGWNGDGTLNADTLYRPDFTDSRIYTYASLTRRLTQEQINLNASTTWTNSFAYDGGTASGPGVLTQMGVPGSSSVNWTGGESPFSSVNAETNTCITYSANGWVNGDSALQAFLDGRSQAIFTNALGNSTNLNAFQWHANMELTPGAHQLKVAALHPSGFYTAWATNSFTNGIAGQTDALTRDAGGNITLRVWLKPNGTTNHQQQLSWDAKNRLTDLIDVDSTQTGYHWHAEYDALDRRLFTSCTVYTNGQDPNLSPVIIDQFYDPMVEFLELGVAYGDQSIFKLYGPDMNGRYGGLNGTGGFDGFSSYLNTFTPVISDFRGNILAEVTNNYFVAWTPARPTGFGAVPGYRPSALGHGADISLASAWRGRWVDISGYYNLGKRVYDPVAGMWLSYDPSWNEADPNYLSFAGGDPINGFDPDGRCFDTVWNGIKSALDTYGQAESRTIAYQTAPSFQIGFNSADVAQRATAQGANPFEAAYEGGSYMVGSFTGFTPAYEGYSGYDIASGTQLDSSDANARLAMGALSILATGRGLQSMVYSPTVTADPVVTPDTTPSQSSTRMIPQLQQQWQAQAGPPPGATTGVQPYQVGTYGDLTDQSLPNDGLQLDHQPSNASNIARLEAELGRPLTDEELQQVRNQGTAVAVPTDWHQTQSPTYGGRNTPAQIQADAQNPLGAATRDSQAMVNGATPANQAAAQAAAVIIQQRAGGL